MRRFRFLIRLLGVLAVGLAAAPTGAAASDLAAQRAQFPAVLALAERGPADSWKRLAAGLEDYPLFPYLEYTALRRGKAPLQREAVDAYLARFPDTLPARDLRNAYLRQLAADGDWAGFRGHWQDTPDRDLRCAWQRARIAAGEKPVYAGQIEPLWMQPRATPGTCDPLFEWARSNGVIDDAAVWQRLLAAAEAGNPETARRSPRICRRRSAAKASASPRRCAIRAPCWPRPIPGPTSRATATRSPTAWRVTPAATVPAPRRCGPVWPTASAGTPNRRTACSTRWRCSARPAIRPMR
ncbi:MAG: hypothetical protein NVV68_16940 [Dokdonella sp.]|nr:hypothetical protein [Dokdonella sp.]